MAESILEQLRIGDLYNKAQNEAPAGKLNEYFAALVVYVTLERAAVECESLPYGGDDERHVQRELIAAIRNLAKEPA